MTTKREIKRRVGKTLARLLDRKRKRQAQRKAAPKSGALSHEPATSKKAVFYQPHRAPGTVFRDTRGDVVAVSERGELKANKKKNKRDRPDGNGPK